MDFEELVKTIFSFMVVVAISAIVIFLGCKILLYLEYWGSPQNSCRMLLESMPIQTQKEFQEYNNSFLICIKNKLQ